MYIGQTGRSFDIRLAEHKSYHRRQLKEKAVFKHSYNTLHSIDWQNSRMVFNSTNEKERLVVESCLIHQLNTFNLMPGASSVTRVSADIIVKNNSRILQNIPRNFIEGIT